MKKKKITNLKPGINLQKVVDCFIIIIIITYSLFWFLTATPLFNGAIVPSLDQRDSLPIDMDLWKCIHLHSFAAAVAFYLIFFYLLEQKAGEKMLPVC